MNVWTINFEYKTFLLIYSINMQSIDHFHTENVMPPVKTGLIIIARKITCFLTTMTISEVNSIAFLLLLEHEHLPENK